MNIEASQEGRLKELSESNQRKWEKIEGLHKLLQDAVEVDPGARSQLEETLAELETEVALLTSEHGNYAECDHLMETLAQPSEVDESEKDRFATQVVESFRQLHQLNDILQQTLNDEQNKLKTVEKCLVEHREIEILFRNDERTRRLEVDRGKNDDSWHSSGADKTDPSATNQQLFNESNSQLRDDLKYLTECIDEGNGGDVDGQKMKLDDLILKLTDRFLSYVDDPYLSVEENDIEQSHVQLLRKCWVIESFKTDDSLIKLLDYTES